MKKYFLILLIIFLTVSSLTGQDYVFSWEYNPTFSNRYKVKVIQKRNRRHIEIVSINLNDSIRERISKEDSDSLLSFLKTYNFVEKKNSIETLHREPVNVEFIPNSKRVVVENDTIWFELLYHFGYVYNEDSCEYYKEWTSVLAKLDGINYSGYFIYNDKMRRYKFSSLYDDINDYNLNKAILSLMKKYYSLEDLSSVERDIDIDYDKHNFINNP